MNQIDKISDDISNSNKVMFLKFDKPDSKYDNYIYQLLNEYKIVNITDTDIIDFYDIEIIPSIYLYKNKNLLGIIEGFNTKSDLLNKIKNLNI